MGKNFGSSVRFARPRYRMAFPTRQRLVLWQINDVSSDKSARSAARSAASKLLLPPSTRCRPASCRSPATAPFFTSTPPSNSGSAILPARCASRKSSASPSLRARKARGCCEHMAEIPDADQRVVDLDLTRQDGRMVPLTLLVEPVGGQSGSRLHDHRDQPPDGGPRRSRTAGRSRARNSSSRRRSASRRSTPKAGSPTATPPSCAWCSTAAPRRTCSRPKRCAARPSPKSAARIEAGLAEALAGRGNIQPIEITAGEQKQFARRIYHVAACSRLGRRRSGALRHRCDRAEGARRPRSRRRRRWRPSAISRAVSRTTSITC